MCIDSVLLSVLFMYHLEYTLHGFVLMKIFISEHVSMKGEEMHV